MTGLAAGIGERLACYRDELPIKARRVQGKLEDAKSVVVADFAVGDWGSRECVVAHAARSHDELTNAAVWISYTVRVL